MMLKQPLVALVVASIGAGAAFAQVPMPPKNPMVAAAIPRESGMVFTADEKGTSISGINTQTGQVATVPVRIAPHNIQVSNDGKTLFAVGAASAGHDMKGSMDAPGRLIVMDAMSVVAEPIADIRVGRHPAHVIVNKQGTRAFVTNGGDNTLSVVNLAERTVLKIIPVGKSPHGLRMSPDGKIIYIANTVDDSVSVVNIEKLIVVGRIKVGKGPVQVAFTPNGRQVYISLRDENSTAVIDTATRKVIAKIPVGRGPIQLFALPNGREIYVANQGTEAAPANTVSVIDTQTLKVAAEITTGAGAHGVVISGDGNRAFITNTFANSVSEIDTSTRQVLRTLSVGAAPGGITFIPAR